MTQLQVRISELDTLRFGVKTASARGVTQGQLNDLEVFCTSEDVGFCIVRTDSREIGTVQALEHSGYRLMDTLLSYSRDLSIGVPTIERPPVLHPSLHFRAGNAVDAEAVAAIARSAFQGYAGHYHADPRLPRHLCDAVYVDWAVRSLSDRNLASWVQVAELGTEVIGFATARLNTPADGEVVLSGVSPTARGMGVYTSFLRNGVEWLAQQGAARGWFVTQVINTAVQRQYVRLGFELDHSEYTLHKWFDAPSQ